jgi:hypothetical protein
MAKTIKQRITDAFPEAVSEADDTSVDYLHALRDSWKEISTSLNRTLFLTLGLAVVFELLAESRGGQVNLGLITVEDTTVILEMPHGGCSISLFGTDSTYDTAGRHELSSYSIDEANTAKR